MQKKFFSISNFFFSPIGSTKASLEVSSAGTDIEKKKVSTQDKAATVGLLSNKEIIAAFREQSLHYTNSKENQNFKFHEILLKRPDERAEVPEWMVKFHELLSQEFTEQPNALRGPANSESKYLEKNYDLLFTKILKLLESMDNILINLKVLLTDKPNGWTDKYTNFVIKMKGLMQKCKESIVLLDSEIMSRKSSKIKNLEAERLISMGLKIEFLKIKRNFKDWDNLSKSVLQNDKKFHKTDDIILVEPVPEKNKLEVHSSDKDEL